MKVNAIPFLLAGASLAVGCKTDEPALGRAPVPKPSAEGASTLAAKPAEAPCRLSVRRLTFTGCNPQPSQGDYPECTNYELAPATEHADHGCIPGLLRLTVSGYAGHLEVALVETKPATAGKIELIVDSLLQPSSASNWTKGTVLGELLLQGSRVEALALTGALKASSFGLQRVTCPGVEGSAGDCLLTEGAKP